MRKVSLLIAHHDAMSRELMDSAFRRRSGFQVTGRVSTSSETLSAAANGEPDVCLISTHLEDGPLSGLIALRRLHVESPHTKSVMLMDSPDRQLIVDSFRGGARGVFCPSLSQFDMLCKCVHRVHAGQIWATSTELNYVLEAFSNAAPLRIVHRELKKPLTAREEDVLRLVADGLTNRDVARGLDLSEHTVKNYLFHIFEKVGVSSRVELVLYATFHGVGPVPPTGRVTEFSGSCALATSVPHRAGLR